MNVFIISASQRFPSQSRKVAQYTEGLIEIYSKFEEINFWDLGENPLPLWEESVWQNDPKWEKILAPLRQKVIRADAYVIVVPEWNGAATPAIKNFSLFFGEKETGHKPVWLISVSSEINGQYPVPDMRAFVYKNNKWIYIPDHTVIRFVRNFFNKSPNEPPENEEEKLLKERMLYSLEQLYLYAKHLKNLRHEIVFDDRFKYAM